MLTPSENDMRVRAILYKRSVENAVKANKLAQEGEKRALICRECGRLQRVRMRKACMYCGSINTRVISLDEGFGAYQRVISSIYARELSANIKSPREAFKQAARARMVLKKHFKREEEGREHHTPKSEEGGAHE